MQLFRHTGVIIAVFWCAAMIVAPMAAARPDTNQGSVPPGMNPGPGNQGNNLMQPGQETGSGNGQNFTGPGQGARPQETGRRNITGFGNHTLPADDRNLTAPREKPGRDFGNATAFNRTARHGPWGGNMTGTNMTDIPPPGEWDPANRTAVSQIWHGHGNGNLTAPPEKPGRDFGNTTAFNRTARHGPWGGNMTGTNMTDIPPPGEWDPANRTAVSQTWHGHGNGNLTPQVPPQESAGNSGQQGGQDQ